MFRVVIGMIGEMQTNFFMAITTGVCRMRGVRNMTCGAVEQNIMASSAADQGVDLADGQGEMTC